MRLPHVRQGARAVTLECSFWSESRNRWVSILVECSDRPKADESAEQVKRWWKKEVARIRVVYLIESDTLIVREPDWKTR